MNIKIDFDNIKVKETRNDFTVKLLMVKGERGYSAYEIAVQNGYEGTEEEWKDSYINAETYYNKNEIDNKLSKRPYCFDNVASMKQSTNLINGSCAQTLGYYNINDGGKALYKIREITNDDVVDNTTIIPLINSELIAELVVDEYVIPQQFGAYGDNIHDDTVVLNTLFNNTKYKKICLKGNYLISDEIVITRGDLIIEGNKSNIKQTSLDKSVIVVDCPYHVLVRGLDIKDLKLLWDGIATSGAIGLKIDQSLAQLDAWGLTNSSFTNISIIGAYKGIVITANNPAWNVYFNNIMIINCIKQACDFETGFNLFLDATVIGESVNPEVERSTCMLFKGGAICKNLDIEDWKTSNFLINLSTSFYPTTIEDCHIERCEISNSYTGFINVANTSATIKNLLVYNNKQSGDPSGIVAVYGGENTDSSYANVTIENVHINGNIFTDTYLVIGSGQSVKYVAVNGVNGIGNKILYPYSANNIKNKVLYNGKNLYYNVEETLPSGVTSTNTNTVIKAGNPYTTTLNGITNQNVKVTMIGIDITSLVYNSSSHVITIESVTGDIKITVA